MIESNHLPQSSQGVVLDEFFSRPILRSEGWRLVQTEMTVVGEEERSTKLLVVLGDERVAPTRSEDFIAVSI